jgi:hypothetical protein
MWRCHAGTVPAAASAVIASVNWLQTNTDSNVTAIHRGEHATGGSVPLKVFEAVPNLNNTPRRGWHGGKVGS